MTTLGDIIVQGGVQHVIVLMQENRSFDEYFGTLPNVNGFTDVSSDAALSALQTAPGAPRYQPFRLSSFTRALNWPATPTGCNHSWAGQHASWGYGALNGWGTDNNNSPIVLGYYMQDDIPYHWWLAQNFLMCDDYYCSALAPTIPNRLYMMTGTAIDPALDPASAAWPNPSTSPAFFGIDAAPSPGQSPAQSAAAGNAVPGWKTYADFLSAAESGGSPLWKVYDLRWDGDPYDNQDNSSATVDLNTLTWFQSTWDVMFPSGYGVASPHYGRGLAALAADVQNGTLPKVAWVFPPYGYSEHPTYNAWDGAALIDTVLTTLLGNDDVWRQSVLVVTYDENDGHYDHVPPIVPDPAVENAARTSLAGPLASRPVANVREFLMDDTGAYQPIGSGFRVPAFIISPWTFQLPNGACSVSFDHTSIIQFMEDVTGVKAIDVGGVDNLTGWRRATFFSLSRVPASDAPVSAATILAAKPANVGTLATAPPPAGSIQAAADARQALLYAVQKNNSNADIQQSYLPYPAAQTPPSWPPMAQSCQLIMRIPSFEKAAVTAQLGNRFPQAVLVRLIGFEPDELSDAYAVNSALQTVSVGAASCSCRVPSFSIVNPTTGAAQPGISCVVSSISANPAQLAPGWASGLPYPFTYFCDLIFDDPDQAFAGISGDTPMTLMVTASFSVDATFQSSAELLLVANPDPQFYHQFYENTSWLSGELRVFAVPEGGSLFGAQLTQGPLDFITTVLQHLNDPNYMLPPTNFPAGSSNIVSTFDQLEQSEDDNPLYMTPTDGNGINVYNFAIARVYMQAPSSEVAANVRVFFRSFRASVTACLYDAGQNPSAYRSYPAVGPGVGLDDRKIPLLGVANVPTPSGGMQLEYISIPFFASQRVALDPANPAQTMASQAADTPNRRTIDGDNDVATAAYFGCWLDFNEETSTWGPLLQIPLGAADPANLDGPWGTDYTLGSIRQAFVADMHQCLIAEISYDGITIQTGDAPGQSAWLAQRNLGFTQ